MDRALKLKSATFEVAPNCLIVSLNIISFFGGKTSIITKETKSFLQVVCNSDFNGSFIMGTSRIVIEL